MKKEYKIFFAIPFDKLTKQAYEDISEELRKWEYIGQKGCHLTTVIGNKQVGPFQRYLDIAFFKKQNAELHNQFFKDIETSDIIVADLTNNNPNVHIELGISLVLNKDILRVTGRDTKELGFDIQNLEVFAYRNKEDLLGRVKGYLKTFLDIKTLDFSEEYGVLYRKVDPFLIRPEGTGDYGDRAGQKLIPEYKFRDGAIRLKFQFEGCLNNDSWMGVFFRAISELNPRKRSYLIYT